MHYRITAPQQLDAYFELPASKSISNRALLIQALTQEPVTLHNLSDCDDTRVMQQALQSAHEHIDIKAAGTAMRFLTAYYSCTSGTHLLTGNERMKRRPIHPLVDALRTLGANITYVQDEGFPPLHIKGQQLQSIPLEVDASISSQFLSALMLISPTLPQGLHLFLKGKITSKPYLDMTLMLMNQFGSQTEWLSDNEIFILPGHYQSKDYTVENDWSAASYAYELVALADRNFPQRLMLQNLQEDSIQGDSRIQDLFTKLGVRTTYNNHGLVLSNDARIVSEPLNENLNDIPDMAQTLAVTCCLLHKPFHFTGLTNLRIKETDRLKALCLELQKLGFRLLATEESLSWDGTRCEAHSTPIIQTYEDHRMAMAFAPAALQYPHLVIAHAEVISKSFPAYWQELLKAGFSLSSQELPPIL